MEVFPVPPPLKGVCNRLRGRIPSHQGDWPHHYGDVYARERRTVFPTFLEVNADAAHLRMPRECAGRPLPPPLSDEQTPPLMPSSLRTAPFFL